MRRKILSPVEMTDHFRGLRIPGSSLYYISYWASTVPLKSAAVAWHSVVDTALPTGRTVQGSNPGRLWGPTQAPVQCVPGFFLGVKRPRPEADNFHLVPRLPVSGTILPLPLYAFIAWRGAALPFLIVSLNIVLGLQIFGTVEVFS